MAIRYSELLRQIFKAHLAECAILDAPHCRTCPGVHSVDTTAAGRNLGPASQTRPIACRLRGRCGGIEGTVFALRLPSREHWPAVDPGARNADEEQSVESGIQA